MIQKQVLVSYEKKLKLLPGYIILIGWLFFTFVLLARVLAASFSTTSEIFFGNVMMFSSGLHCKNYKKEWTTSNVPAFFTDSPGCAVCSCILRIIICVPYAGTLQCFNFKDKKIIYSALAAAVGASSVIVIVPLYTLTAQTGVLKTSLSNCIVLISLFTSVKISCATTFFTVSFASISSTCEEKAAIDGSHPILIFWRIIFPLVHDGIKRRSIINNQN